MIDLNMFIRIYTIIKKCIDEIKLTSIDSRCPKEMEEVI